MGFSNFIKDAAAKTNDLVKKEHERKELIRQKEAERAMQTCIYLSINSGFQQLNVLPNVTMRQLPNGDIYFGMDESNLYRLIEYSWNGPQFNTITNSQTNGIHKTKGKAGKIGAGAIVGTLLLPGAGTLVGAAMGAGSKGKKEIHENTNTISQQIEIPTSSTLKFLNLSTQSIVSIVIKCDSLIDSKIKCFNIYNRPDFQPSITATENQNFDSIDEIKKYKELLDSGIISQDEFDSKKKQLLNI